PQLSSNKRFTLPNLTVSCTVCTFSVSFSRIVPPRFSLSASLATTYEIVSHPLPLVNPVFRLFPFLYAFGAFWRFLGRVGAI
ncbi:MAG: hypothetical protein MR371_05835, partial [Clostridia bacterium]|nr:hypothetical protein [Clostridia bacterium]